MGNTVKCIASFAKQNKTNMERIHFKTKAQPINCRAENLFLLACVLTVVASIATLLH